MRVLLISHTCQSRREGQPKAAQLGRLPGVELRVLVPDRWREYRQWRAAQEPLDDSFALEVGHVRWPWSGPGQWYLHHYPGLARTLREFKPDVIDIWEEPWGLVSVQAAWLRDRLLPNAKIISETEQNVAKTLPPPFEWFRSYTLRRADYVVGRSAEAVENTRAKGYRGPAGVVPNAVDADLFRPLERGACREALGLSGYVVGYVGRIVEEKGLTDLVDALSHCPEDVSLLLLGGGPYKEALSAHVQKADLGHRVRFLPSRPMDELPQVMNAVDVLALPSRTTPRWKEQFGRVLIEAQACGTPVIGSDSGAIPQVIGPGGLVFPEGDPSKLAGRIKELRADPEAARDLGRSGRRQVEDRYTWARVGQQMWSIYREVTGQGDASPGHGPPSAA